MWPILGDNLIGVGKKDKKKLLSIFAARPVFVLRLTPNFFLMLFRPSKIAVGWQLLDKNFVILFTFWRLKKLTRFCVSLHDVYSFNVELLLGIYKKTYANEIAKSSHGPIQHGASKASNDNFAHVIA